jgi:hypothetical protein
MRPTNGRHIPSAGFFHFPKHLNTNALTVFGVAGKDSNRYARQLSAKIYQSPLHARIVFCESAPLAIDDQSANRSTCTEAPEAAVVVSFFHRPLFTASQASA